MATKWSAYQKCLNVIDSCKTLEQANNAYKYCELMYDMYADYPLYIELYNIMSKKFRDIEKLKSK